MHGVAVTLPDMTAAGDSSHSGSLVSRQPEGRFVCLTVFEGEKLVHSEFGGNWDFASTHQIDAMQRFRR